MKTTTKRVYKGRNTGCFYALIAQLPDYNSRYKDTIVDGVIDSYLVKKYGMNHGREVRLSRLSDVEYEELLKDLRKDVCKSKTLEELQMEAARREITKQILKAFGRIGVIAVDDDYSDVNYHILRLPISKGRIIPQFPFEELGKLLDAVRSYCDNMSKKQLKMQKLIVRN